MGVHHQGLNRWNRTDPATTRTSTIAMAMPSSRHTKGFFIFVPLVGPDHSSLRSGLSRLPETARGSIPNRLLSAAKPALRPTIQADAAVAARRLRVAR